MRSSGASLRNASAKVARGTAVPTAAAVTKRRHDDGADPWASGLASRSDEPPF